MTSPSAPDPMKTANTAFNYAKKAGIFQNELSRVNQITPTGSLTYRVVGHRKDGSPKLQATTELNPEQQALLDAQTGTSTAGAKTAGDIIGQNAGSWAAGPDMDETGITKSIMGWGHDYLQPVFDSQNASEDARLQNQGIMPGSEAWTNAHRDTSRNQNDAYTKLLLEGQGQAMNAAEAKYMDPLKAVSTLSSGAQPSVSFAQTPQAGGISDPTNFSQNAYASYGAKQQQSNDLMSGLFKIPTTLLGGWASGGL